MADAATADRSRHLSLLQDTDELLVTLLEDAATALEALSDADEAAGQRSSTAFLKHLQAVQANLRTCIADLPDASLRFARDPIAAETLVECELQRRQFHSEMAKTLSAN
eukprot:EG_transcript_33504